MKSRILILVTFGYLLLWAVAGCTPNTNANVDAFKAAADKVTSGLVAIDTNTSSLTESLKLARTHSDAIGQGAIDAALRSAAAIAKTVADTQAAEKKGAAAFDAEHLAREASDAKVAELEASYLSPRQKAQLRWLLIAIASISVLTIVLVVAGMKFDVITTILGAIWSFITGALKFVGHTLTLFVIPLTNAIKAHTAKVDAIHEAVVPAPVSITAPAGIAGVITAPAAPMAQPFPPTLPPGLP